MDLFRSHILCTQTHSYPFPRVSRTYTHFTFGYGFALESNFLYATSHGTNWKCENSRKYCKGCYKSSLRTNYTIFWYKINKCKCNGTNDPSWTEFWSMSTSMHTLMHTFFTSTLQKSTFTMNVSFGISSWTNQIRIFNSLQMKIRQAPKEQSFVEWCKHFKSVSLKLSS